MSKSHRALPVIALLVCLPLFAQSADQAITSVTDSPDPVTPGQTLTYTVQMTNNGPDPAVNGGLNVNLPLAVTYQNATGPAGFTCSAFGSNVSCTNPSFASGASATFTITVVVSSALVSFPDGSFTANFFPSGTTVDPVSGNNFDSETTNYDTPQIDLALTVTDSPDPVAPNGNITYTVPVKNNGPDAATNVNFSLYNNGSLRFQSVNVPSGWTCSAPAVGSTPTFNCSTPSLASGVTSNFTIVVNADQTIIGINDTTVQTAFSVGGTGNDTNTSNDSETETTAYVAPDADMTVSASDSPDPVTPDNDITYTIQVGNTGPDAATNATLGIYNNGSLEFQSIVVPSGWSCTAPAVNATPTFNCTNPSFANGGSSTFTLVVRADSVVIGNADTTVQTNFSVSSGAADPDNSDNSETETTAYDVSNANLGIAVTDAPDPVAGGSNITYSGTITNAGPDAAASATLTAILAPSLLFQSLSGPAGFTCSTPAIGVNGTVSCTIASLGSGASVPFTLVAQVNPSVNSGPDGTIQQTFGIASSTNDPTPGNESVLVNTSYTTPDADLHVTNSDAPDPVAPSGTITYTQTLRNDGPDTATNAAFTQSTPAGTTFQSLAAAAGWSCTTPAIGATGAINCTKSSMTSGESASFTLVVNVTATSGTISGTVTGDSDTYDPDPSDNAATAATSVVTPASADLSLTKSTNATSAPAGSTITYTIALHNSGPDAASNATMTDTLPASLLFQSITAPAGFTCTTPAVGTSGTITCTKPSLANGATATFTLAVKVAAGSTSGNVSNSASASSATSDPDSGDASVSSNAVALAPASADLSIIKSTNASTVVSGTTLTYTISVTNDGPSDATNVHVTDTLPAEVELVSANPSQGTCDATIDCALGTLTSGASATITLQVRAIAASGTIANSASVSAAETDPVTGDNDSTAPSVTITAAPQAVTDIPTLSEWALIALAMMLGMLAVVKARG